MFFQQLQMAIKLYPYSHISGSNSFDSATGRRQLYNLTIVYSTLLLLGYVVVFPTGIIGLLLTMTVMFLSLVSTNKVTLGVFLITFGRPLIGALMQAIGVSGLGSFLAVIIGLLLISSSGEYKLRFTRSWVYPFFWLLISSVLLGVFYLLGPMSEYSQSKLFGYLTNLILFVIAFDILFRAKRIDIWQLGILFIIASIAYYSIIIYLNPQIAPISIYSTAGLRIGSDFSQIVVATNTLAIMASAGILLLVGAMVDRQIPTFDLYVSIAFLVLSFIVLNSTGQRLFLFIPPIACASIFLARPLNRKFLRTSFAIFSILVVVSVAIGLQSKNKYVLSVFESNQSISERSNRSINWDAALRRIQEKPYLGHGLGGYFIEGYSFSGSGTYAHNLFLELLSEVGTIGFFIILAPIISLFVIPAGRKIYLIRTNSDATLVPLLVMEFLHAMFSHDLAQSSILFALLSAQWAYLSEEELSRNE